MGNLSRIILVTVALVALALAAASCGDASTSSGRQHLADVADLTLEKGRPGHVWVFVEHEQKLRVFLLTERPLESCTLAKVLTADGEAMPVQLVDLQGSPHTAPEGGTVYAPVTREPVTPGTYRVEFVGSGRITSLTVDERGTE
jgi:hypothetical protein